MNTHKKTFTKKDVVDIIEMLRNHPDQLTDSVENPYSDWTGEKLLDLALGAIRDEQNYEKAKLSAKSDRPKLPGGGGPVRPKP